MHHDKATTCLEILPIVQRINFKCQTFYVEGVATTLPTVQIQELASSLAYKIVLSLVSYGKYA